MVFRVCFFSEKIFTQPKIISGANCLLPKSTGAAEIASLERAELVLSNIEQGHQLLGQIQVISLDVWVAQQI